MVEPQLHSSCYSAIPDKGEQTGQERRSQSLSVYPKRSRLDSAAVRKIETAPPALPRSRDCASAGEPQGDHLTDCIGKAFSTQYVCGLLTAGTCSSSSLRPESRQGFASAAPQAPLFKAGLILVGGGKRDTTVFC